MNVTQKRHLYLTLWLLLALSLVSGGELHAGEAIIERPDFDGLQLGVVSDYLEDASGTLQFDAVRARDLAWTPLAAPHLNAHFNDAAMWLRVSLRNQSGRDLSMLLDTGTAVADFIDIYVLRQNGQLHAVRARDLAWTPLAAPHLNAHFNDAAMWLRVSLRNQSGRDLSMLLDTGTAVADFIDIYVLRQNGQLQAVRSGDRRPFSSRPMNSRTVTLPLELANREQVTIYLRQASWDGLLETLTPTLWSQEAYADQLQMEALVFGFLYGSLGALLVYNLFLFVSTRQRGFHLYLLFVASFLAWSFTFRGYGFQYLWPNSPALNNLLLPMLASACYCAFGLFALDYLQIRRKAPAWIHRANWLAIVLNGLVLFLPLSGLYATTFAILFVTGVLMHVIAVTTSLILIRRGYRPARFFLLAFTFLALGVLIYYLHLLGWLSANPFTRYGIQVGASLEVLLLAFGLADRMNTLKAEKLQAEQEARSAQLTLTTKLTDEVRLRTLELEQANLRLNELSITDELTGCYNRRHFNRVFEEELASHRRQRTPLAFCMIDIDCFKAYNDRCGHQAGDEILRQVTQCLRDRLKRLNDHLFRLGGEEFGMLLHLDQPTVKAAAFVEELRQAVELLALPHPASPTGCVTASFGLVLLDSNSAPTSAAALYAQADSLLYQAKAEGRNRVVYSTT